MPAILFIVCVSDLMHLNNDSKIMAKSKIEFFKKKSKNIGVPVALTSLTTAIGFLSFCFSDVLPITRFGFITTLGIVISLFIILVSYAIRVDLNFHQLKGNDWANKKIKISISDISNIKSRFAYYSILSLMIFLMVFH